MANLLPKAAAAALALAFMGAGLAFAAGQSTAVATLATTLERPNNAVVAAGVVWSCAQTTCTARLERRAPVARDCRQLVREVGAITRFEVNGTALDDAGLARCNGN